MRLSMGFKFVAVLILGVFFLSGMGGPVVAQDTAAPVVVEPSPNDVKELLRLLADENVQSWLQKSVDTQGPNATEQASVSIRDQLGVGLATVRQRLSALGQAWVHLPRTPKMIADRWQSEMTLHLKVRSLTYLVIFLFVGAGLEWLYRQYTTIALLRLAMQSHAAPVRRAKAALMRAGIIAVGLILFALGSVGVFLAFDWPPLIEALVLNFLIVVIVMRAVHALSAFVIAPSMPDLRLVPLSNRLAKHFSRMIALVTGIVLAALAISDIFSRLTMVGNGDIAPAVLAVSVAMGLVVVLALTAVVWHSFRLFGIEVGSEHAAQRRNWRVYLNVLIGGVFVLWLVGAGAVMWTVLVVGALFPILALMRVWVNYFFDEAREARLQEAPVIEPVEGAADEITSPNSGLQIEEQEDEEDVPQDLPDPFGTFRFISLRFVRFVIIILTVIVLTGVWDASILSLSKSTMLTGRVFSVLVDATFVILVADLVWAWAKMAIDKRLAAYVPPEGSEAPGPEARMATLLPLLRMALLVALSIMVIFSILSSLGVNIAPLIAGAGVLGIAIGFGAQSLVRDVVSGIFFLIDDAFRLGEYIEVGELRGTVEGISIRSLRVRHHRGAIHTIPFGELKYLTNHSRDWVIMKLEFRVPFDTDLKLVKKLIKKVGAELEQNEFYGSSILQTLKSQGVRRMEEFNMVVGVKFMTKPGEQWLVRRDAYQMVRDIFEANGIQMAERNVKVEIKGGEGLDEASRLAVAGAAQEAAEGPKLPPGPVPDEP